MTAFVKFGVALAGYVAAVMAADAAVAVRIANTSGPDAQASAGMYAFGDGLLFVAVFSAVAIFPTGLALWFLRPYRWFWVGLSVTALAIAATAVLSALVYAVAAHVVLPRQSPLALGAAFAVLRMLLSPPLAAAFVVAGIIAPARASRWSLLAAAGARGRWLGMPSCTGSPGAAGSERPPSGVGYVPFKGSRWRSGSDPPLGQNDRTSIPHGFVVDLVIWGIWRSSR